MRFTSGWVKSYRSLDDGKHWIGKNAISYAIFHRLIAWANYQETKVLRRGTFIKVPRGALITSSHEIAVSLELERKTVERYLALLENDGTIVQQVTHRGRIITICNYDKYQDIEESDVQQMSNSSTNSCPTPAPHNEELKNSKKAKNQRTKELSTLAPLESEWVNLGQHWLDHGLSQMPWQAKNAKWTSVAFGSELKRIGRVMGIDHTGMRVMFEKAIQDEFWHRQIASPFGLMSKGKNGNRKIDNLLVSLKATSRYVYCIFWT